MTLKNFARALLPASAILVATAIGASAQDRATGPAAAAVEHWFLTSKNIACITSEAKPRPCKIDLDTGFHVFYGNGGRDALAFVTWLPDATGNAVALESAHFQFDGGRWMPRKRIALRTNSAPSSVAFAPGHARFVVPVLRASDGRCCPTGREAHDVAL